MRLSITIIILLLTVLACRKPALEEGTLPSDNKVPWTDSSNTHPKNAKYRDLIEKYRKQGFPGISLLVNDRYGTWVGSTGYADIEA